MRAHVQNPWTKRPSLMINLSVEDARCLRAVLEHYAGLLRRTGEVPDDNVLNAARDLQRTLDHAFQTDRPHGVRGVEP